MAKRRAAKRPAAKRPASKKPKADDPVLDTPAADKIMACGNGVAHKPGTNGHTTNGHAIDEHAVKEHARNMPSEDKGLITTEGEQTPSHGSETSVSKRRSMSTVAEDVSQASSSSSSSSDAFAFNGYTEFTLSPDHASDANLCDPAADGAHEHRTPDELEAAYTLAFLLPNGGGGCKRRSERIENLTKKAEESKAQNSKTKAQVSKANASKAKARRAKSEPKHAPRFIFSVKKQPWREEAAEADGKDVGRDEDRIVKRFVSAATAENTSVLLVADALCNMAKSG